MRYLSIMALYSCDLCPQTFKNGGRLTNHLQTKHKDASEPKLFYRCEKFLKCNTVFRTEENLRLHEKTHEIRYVCDVCGIRIYRKWNFEHHMKTKHI